MGVPFINSNTRYKRNLYSYFDLKKVKTLGFTTYEIQLVLVFLEFID